MQSFTLERRGIRQTHYHRISICRVHLNPQWSLKGRLASDLESDAEILSLDSICSNTDESDHMIVCLMLRRVQGFGELRNM